MPGQGEAVNTIRNDLLSIYRAALSAVEGRRCVRQHLQRETPDGHGSGSIYLVAVGKAAVSMTRGAFDVLDERIAAALVITRHGYGEDLSPWPVTLVEAGHPLPDQYSLEAGARLLDFLHRLPAGAPCLFLISGGASALVEVLPDGVSLVELRAVNDTLLGSGLGIAAMNRVRKALSCIKDGRLAHHLSGHPVLALLISDVPGDDPAVIGSGLLAVQPPAPLPRGLPAWLQALLGRNRPAPSPGDPCLSSIRLRVIANAALARAAAARQAADLGYRVCVHERVLLDAVARAGSQVLDSLRTAPGCLHIWSAEPTVILPPQPGRGGRCQALALSIAVSLQPTEQASVLAAGSDGSDGPGQVAGALVDAGTVVRGHAAGQDPLAALAAADSGSFLDGSGDLLTTGPTGTNVMDLVLAFLPVMSKS